MGEVFWCTRWAAWPALALSTVLLACIGEIGSPSAEGAGGGLRQEPCPTEGETQDCYPGSPATRGIGECVDGLSICTNGTWSECAGHQLPSEELCDDLDNNCDGVVDESCGCGDGETRPCYSGSAATADIGECTSGSQHCWNGAWTPTCEGEVLPGDEVCDGLDNNCNGLTDDGCECVNGATQPCYTGPNGTENVGLCLGGLQTCEVGEWPMNCPGEVTPATEICNGSDDDCDGQADEGDPGGGGSCSTGQPGVCASGTNACTGGSLTCVPTHQASAEQCDGLDNDCDGQTDEGNPGGGGSCNTGQPGICAAGTTTCSGGSLSCIANQQPTSEVCGNGLDDDCDGAVDDGCGCAHGVCSTGVALQSGCDPCVTAVCNADPYCCSTSWDNLCVGEVQTECGKATCAVNCAHSPCSTGPSSTPLSAGCDSPGTCVSQVCAADPYCCNTDWDTVCVNEVGTICGLSC